MLKNRTKKSILFESVTLSKGWSGIFSLSDRCGEKLDIEDWQKSFADVDQILESPDKVLKKDGQTSVIVKILRVGSRKRFFVIKSHRPTGFTGFIRQLFRNKALRSYKRAVRLHNLGIPVAFPCAAIQKKTGFLAERTLFVTEYMENSVDLHKFVSKNFSADSNEAARQHLLKKQIGTQVARIFADMHRFGLWHRDAKAKNFLVCPGSDDEDIEVKLVDMDGIKRVFPGYRNRGQLSLAKLASTLIFTGGISDFDYLRSFAIYSNLIKLNRRKSRKLAADLERKSIGLRLMTLAKSVMKYHKS